MKTIRVIIQSTENGESEYVRFTEDFEAEAGDFLYPGHTLDSDTVIENNLPPGFPIDSDLKRD